MGLLTTIRHKLAASLLPMAGVSRSQRLLDSLLVDLTEWPDVDPLKEPVNFDLADAEKVAPHVFRKLEAGRLGNRQWDARADRIALKRRLLEKEAADLAHIAREFGVRYLFLRGFAAQAHYPPGYVRQFNDLDLAVATDQELTRFLPALERRGYYPSRPPAVRRNLDGSDALCVMALNRRHSDLEEPLMLDLYLGGFSITAHTHARLTESAFDGADDVVVGGGTIRIPDPTQCFINSLIETFDRKRLLLRDLLDLEVLVKSDPDLSLVRREVRRLHIGARIRWVAKLAQIAGMAVLAQQLRSCAPGPDVGRASVAAHLWPQIVAESWRLAPARLAYAGAQPWLDRLENRFPNRMLSIYSEIPVKWPLGLGLPIYLFRIGPDCITPSALYEAWGRRYLARCRPLVSEEEVDALVAGI